MVGKVGGSNRSRPPRASLWGRGHAVPFPVQLLLRFRNNMDFMPRAKNRTAARGTSSYSLINNYLGAMITTAARLVHELQRLLSESPQAFCGAETQTHSRRSAMRATTFALAVAIASLTGSSFAQTDGKIAFTTSRDTDRASAQCSSRLVQASVTGAGGGDVVSVSVIWVRFVSTRQWLWLRAPRSALREGWVPPGTMKGYANVVPMCPPGGRMCHFSERNLENREGTSPQALLAKKKNRQGFP